MNLPVRASPEEDFPSTAKSLELPEKLEADFVHALQEVLSGLVKIEMRGEDIKGALVKGGTPATVEELKSRFDSYLADRTKGLDQSKVRIILG